MKIPLSLIQSFLTEKRSLSEIAETLTLLGIEVDRIHNERPFSGVVAGKVEQTAPHPNAEKLRIAQVHDGKKLYQVVCGAANCRPGITVAFAQEGACLIDSCGKSRTIEPCEIRGVPSSGMLCAEEELGLTALQEGILELPQEILAGTDLALLLWDPVFEISLTPNLGHCMSALGIARELSAALCIPLRQPEIPSLSADQSKKKELYQITIADMKLCPRYLCLHMDRAKIAPSPFWLQRTLIASGIRPISNAVDVSNYILLKRGQPLHIFDADCIEGEQIHIGPASHLVDFLGLDDVQYQVPEGVLLISDAKRPIALAGLLGGKNSAVTDRTHSLLIEAAVFQPARIRKGAKQLGIRTESSQRFEKGIDPNGTASALKEAASLLQELCNAVPVGQPIEAGLSHFPPQTILCRPHRMNQLLGTKLSFGEMEEIFCRLGFIVQRQHGEQWQVLVPPYRSDVVEEIDLIEELARIYGYNHIERKQVRFSTSSVSHDAAYLFESEIRERLIALGLQEFLNANLISPKLVELAQEWLHPEAKLLTALAPKTEEYSILRPSLIAGMMQSAANNFAHKTNSFQAFELGRIHFLQNEQLVERPMAAILLTGKTMPSHWSQKPVDTDFFNLKGIIENLLDSLRIEASIVFPSSIHPSFHPERQANLVAKNRRIGSFGELHPKLLSKLDLRQRLLYAELDMQLLQELRGHDVRMQPLPKYPSSERDWTIALPSRFVIQKLLNSIRSIRPPLLEKVELIDLYIPETSDQKNMSFRFTYRDASKTVSFEEVEQQHRSLIAALEASLLH